MDSLDSLLNRYSWVAELAGILPLSALIDFIEIPPKLHVLELTGSVPLWSWAITPSGSRLLLAKPNKVANKPSQQDCCMDQFGNAPTLEALDGRFGERYFVSNPETLRLILEGSKVVPIENDHMNMSDEKLTRRTQNLEIIHLTRHERIVVSRAASGARQQMHSGLPTHIATQTSSKPSAKVPVLTPLRCRINHFLLAPPFYIATYLIGWTFWISTLIVSGFFGLWICLAFVLLLPITGTVVSLLFGAQPRKLLVDKPSEYVRLIVIAEHMNTATWRVVLGESSIVNSLVNRPLEPNKPEPSSTRTAICRVLLRLCILGQWGLVLGASATKRWDAYVICLWIAFPIFCHAYLIPPSLCVKSWSKNQANIKVRRYSTRVSTRRSLLNTIVALNPDSFGRTVDKKAIDYNGFNDEGMKWLDHVLSKSSSREEWERATLEAMPVALKELGSMPINSPKFSDPKSDFPASDWNAKYRRFSINRDTGETEEYKYWRRFVPEGIYVAYKIQQEAHIPSGGMVWSA